MPLPNKNYHTLQSLASRWSVSFDDIRYYVEHKELAVCFWLDYRKLMRYLPDENEDKIICEYLHFEGYVGLNASDCRKVFRCGKYKITNFYDLNQADYLLTLTPNSKEVLITINDMVVTTEERNRFEIENDIEPSDYSIKPCKAEILGRIEPKKENISVDKGLYINSKKYQYLYNGIPFKLGAVQSVIVKQLAQSHSTDRPWLHGKILLKDAGSNAARIRDLFKSNPIWNEIIDSDRRGNYRIKEGLLVNME